MPVTETTPFARALGHAVRRGNRSYTSKGLWRQGNRLFCKDFLRFNTVPCRHMPLHMYMYMYMYIYIYIYIYIYALPREAALRPRSRRPDGLSSQGSTTTTTNDDNNNTDM